MAETVLLSLLKRANAASRARAEAARQEYAAEAAKPKAKPGSIGEALVNVGKGYLDTIGAGLQLVDGVLSRSPAMTMSRALLDVAHIAKGDKYSDKAMLDTLIRMELVKTAFGNRTPVVASNPVGAGMSTPGQIGPGNGKAYLNSAAEKKASRAPAKAAPRSTPVRPGASAPGSDGRTAAYSRVNSSGLVVNVQGYSTPKR